MPESKNRRKQNFTPPRGARGPTHARAWVPPVMLTCFILGLVWIVVFYVAGDLIPGMSALDSWNILIGMGLIAVGFVVSTQWR